MRYKPNFHLVIKPDGYYTQQRPEMLEFVPQNASKILDVGCGEGIFASQLRQKLNSETWGVEIDSKAAELAERKIDNVLVGDVTELVNDLPNLYFDCIIFNDLLEHLVNPFSFLLEIKSKVNSRGVIVCSIPNVRYFPVLKELVIEKQWRYVNAGILDKTHLRFFTKNSIIDMFNSLDFKILRIEGINPLKSKKIMILNWLSLGHLSDIKYMQFACVVKPK